MISVLIMTRNEEGDLPHCLATLAWCDDVQVFDSFSTDRTAEVAREAGAHVQQRVFDGYASQKNAALQTLRFRHSWVLMLDADERIPVETQQKLADFVRAAPASVAAGRLRRRDYFQGRWLKHASMSPFNVRLVQPTRVRFDRQINEVLLVDGATQDIDTHFDHFPFSKGIAYWVERHNRYSTMEAERARDERQNNLTFHWGQALFARDINTRRYHLKGKFYRLPMRPVVKWMYQIVWRRAFLDGWPGIYYATLQALYEMLIVLKEKEIEARSGDGASRE